MSFAIKSSKFMQTSLRGEWKEAREKRVSLPETQASDFKVYLEWLYTDSIAMRDDPSAGTDGSSADKDGIPDTDGTTLVRLYVLGDFLGDDRFCNAIIDTLVHHVNRDNAKSESVIVFDTTSVDLAWDRTARGSPLQRVLTELILCDLGDHPRVPMFLNRGAWSPEASVDIFEHIQNHRSLVKAIEPLAKDPRVNKDKCAYHKHGKGCPKCT